MAFMLVATAVAAVYVASMLMNTLDSTIVIVALATLGREFNVPAVQTEAVVVAYLVSLAVFIPASGWLGDRFGTKRIFLILEFAGKGELYKHLRKAGKFPEWQAAQYIAQMASALKYLHKKHVMHRDIKPENILVGIHGEIKISDFGWSVHAPNNRRNTMCGTLDYLPPEMIKPGREENWYTEKVDLWSLGVLTYEFLVGEAPFEDTPVMTQRRIAKCDMSIPPNLSAEARDLIKRLLVLDPERRISLEDVETHPWIIKHCVKGERAYNRASFEKKG